MLGSIPKGLKAALAAAVLAGVTAPPALAGEPPAPVVLHVSPGGSGTACSASFPCGLFTAQTEVRKENRDMRSNIEVVLSGGTYQLGRTFELGPSDSGTNGRRVIYEAAAGATPVLSGGRAITGWRRVPGTTATWVATVPKGFDTRQLYINGQNVPLSKGLPPATTFVQTSAGFIATSTALDTWKDPSDIAVDFQGGNGPWTETSCNIASVSGLTVDMSQPCWSNLHFKSEGVQELGWFVDPHGGFNGLSPAATPTALENAYELLTPGHWSIDRVTHQIFYMAEPGQDPARSTVVAPALQTLVQIRGTLTAPVRDITLQGLQFSYGGWTAPDGRDGFAQMQADWTLTGPNAANVEGNCQYSTPPGSCPFASWTRTPANVVLTAARNVDLVGDTFSHLGGAGLDVYYGSRGDVIQGNEFEDIAASAIQLGSTNDPLPSDLHAGAAEVNDHNTIDDNYIHDVAIQYLGGIGIWVGYTADTNISNNQIDDVPYTAISLGWGGWHANASKPNIDPNINSGNVIANNVLYDYMTTLGDGGAIYTNGSQATSFASALHMSGNVAYGGANTDFSLYTDTGSQYVYVTGNFVYDQPFDSFDTGGCHTVGHIRIDDNYFAPGGPAYPCSSDTDVTTGNNTTVCEDPTPDQAPLPILRAAGLAPSYRYLLDRAPPAVTMVGPTGLPVAGGQVLVSGSGFQPHTAVYFGAHAARSVQVLSANYLLATAPPGTGTAPVTVRTGSGTSAPGATVAYQEAPLPCVDYLGGGFSTALFTGSPPG